MIVILVPKQLERASGNCSSIVSGASVTEYCVELLVGHPPICTAAPPIEPLHKVVSDGFSAGSNHQHAALPPSEREHAQPHLDFIVRNLLDTLAPVEGRIAPVVHAIVNHRVI